MNFSIALLKKNRPRNRRGRGLRGVLMLPVMPASKTKKISFDDLIVKIVREIYRQNPKLPKIEFATEEVPVSLPAEWEDYQVCLARAFPRDKTAGLAPRIVIYRLPILNRIKRKQDLEPFLEVLISNYLSDLSKIKLKNSKQSSYAFLSE